MHVTHEDRHSRAAEDLAPENVTNELKRDRISKVAAYNKVSHVEPTAY